MKKTLLVLVAVLSLGFAANAQNAIGIRGGLGSGYIGEISYQAGMGSNRVELDLGLRHYDDYNGFNLTGVYQWVFNLTGNFNWYAGLGPKLSFYNHDDSHIALGVGGQLGIEYNFAAIPLRMSLDWRPMYDVIGNADNSFDYGIALGVRFVF